MSHTTFSNMSNPDLLITIQAYTYMQEELSMRMMTIKTIPIDDEMLKNELEILQLKLTRVNELTEALVQEYDKRENS